MCVCSEERLLADVVGFFGRADQGVNEVEYAPFVPLDERCESVLVSSQDERDELLVCQLPNNGGSSVVKMVPPNRSKSFGSGCDADV